MRFEALEFLHGVREAAALITVAGIEFEKVRAGDSSEVPAAAN